MRGAFYELTVSIRPDTRRRSPRSLGALAAALVVLATSSAGGELGPIRPRFQVSSVAGYEYPNSPHDEALWSIDVAASDAGQFVVAWEDIYTYLGERPGFGIFARRLDSLARPITGEFRATPLSSIVRGSSHIASDSAGNFVVVWDENDDYLYPVPPGISDTDGDRVMARRFSASGAAGVAFQVNTFTTGGQYTPKVAFDGAGRFVVVWAFYDQDRGAVLAGQKYDATGTPIGGEFQVNTNTSCCVGYTGFEWPPLFDDIDIAGDAAGNFVVVWRGPSASGGVGNDIAARFFDVTGAPTSPDQLVVNEDTSSDGRFPAVTRDHNGNFVVVWRQKLPDDAIMARRFDASGTPLGGDLQVNTAGDFYFNDAPSVAADPSGRFVVVWPDSPDEDRVMGREFDSAGAPAAEQFRIDTHHDENGPIQLADVAAGGPGQFVVVWSQAYYTYETGSVSRAFARRLGHRAAPCSPAPLSDCRETTVAGSGVLTFKMASNPARNRLTWRFARGPGATLPDFGDPFTTDSYTVCLYDASAAPQPLYEAAVPGSGACGTIPCWRVLSTGAVDYFDPREQFVEGVTEIRLSPGTPGRSRVLVRGRGARLALPDPPLTAPVTLQLQGSNGTCWTAEYATRITRNATGIFKAKPD